MIPGMPAVPPIRWHDLASDEAKFNAEVKRRVREEREARRMDAAVKARQALIDAFGEDQFADGMVVTFQKRYEVNGTEYTFAAIKANGKWYATGMSFGDKGLSWDTFIERLVDGIPVTKLILMQPVPELPESIASEIQHALDHPENLVRRERPVRRPE